jgi:carbon monoxide dehydrogenase subunit G
MIHFEGDKHFPLPVAVAAAKLSDAGFLVNCLPDATVSEATPDRAAWALRPRLSFLTGSLDATMTVTAREVGESAAFRIATRAMGAGSAVDVKLAFADTSDGGTAVHWTGDIVEITGLLKMVPKGLLQATAQKVIEDVWAAVTERLTPSE